jgi:uncharacterized membrane protein
MLSGQGIAFFLFWVKIIGFFFFWINNLNFIENERVQQMYTKSIQEEHLTKKKKKRKKDQKR